MTFFYIFDYSNDIIVTILLINILIIFIHTNIILLYIFPFHHFLLLCILGDISEVSSKIVVSVIDYFDESIKSKSDLFISQFLINLTYLKINV